MTNLIPSALNLIAHSVAQTAGSPPLPGETAAVAAPGAPGSAATGGAAPGATNAAPGGSSFMIMMIVLLGAMILFSFVSSRREKKKRDQLLGNIKKHDKVLTIGGVVGTVVEVKDAEIVLKVDETSNTRITFTKSAISQVIPQDAAA
jgi:preprotein translocase subunit YajC